MRHGDKINNLSRTASHRKALLANLACQLITYKRIVTTIAKAKALRVYVEPLITKSKDNSTHQYRVVFSYLKDKDAVKELFTVVAGKVANRPGGYTRIIKLGTRTGDNAELAMIELVDFNTVYGKGVEEKTETTKRTRRAGGRKKGPDTAAPVEGTTSGVPEAAHEAASTVTETSAPVADAPAPENSPAPAPEADIKSEEKPAE
ncbi:MAG: 50S ribosomal protein L17 [Chitinophagaceae bacterium]